MHDLYGRIVEQSALQAGSTRAAPSPNTHGEFHWQPPRSIKFRLPADFAIPMKWRLDTEGYQRLLPTDGKFLAQAQMAGVAILSDVRNLNDQERQAYRFSWFLYQLGTRMREHATRQFRSKQDLIIRRTGRGGGLSSSTLPEPLTVDELVNRGLEIGRLAGQNFSDAMAIRHALTDFAECCPLNLAEGEIGPLIRASLFELSAPANPGVRTFVEERLLRLFHDHYPDSQHQFDRWFFPGHGNLVKAIADQKKAPGGKLQHDDVRNILLEMSWKSFFDVGSCLHATARYIENAWGERLNAQERMIFEAMYLPQPHFGGLPLLLLSGRIGFISTIVEKIIQAPGDRSLPPVLYRLLQIYTEMLVARRAADRQSKRTGSSESTECNPDRLPQPVSTGDDRLLGAMAEELAKDHGLSCSECNTWVMVLPADFTGKASLELELFCDCRRQGKKFSTTVEDLKVIGDRVAQRLPT
jgi:hypothetical protein